MRKLIFKNTQSPGDLVMLTAAVRDLHLCYPDQFVTDVRTSCPQLWEHNPYLTSLNEADPDVEVIDCEYPLIHQCNTAPWHFIHGFIHFLNDRLGLNIQVTECKGDIHLSGQEKSWPSQVKESTGAETPFWLVIAGGKNDFTIKWWHPDRYQKVVDHFRGHIQFVQVGSGQHHHPTLEGVINLVHKTDVRQLIRLVYHSQGVLCPVTFAMHLAAAVEVKPGKAKTRPCVVVAGGREPPQWETYPNHQFLHTVGALSCCQSGGCWKSRVVPLGDGDEKDSPNNLCVDVVGRFPRCMDMISAEKVIWQIEKYYAGGLIRYAVPTKLPKPGLKSSASVPLVTICVLTYGNYPELARRCIGSIQKYCDRSRYRLVVGANAICEETEDYLRRLESKGAIDMLHISETNINKCPMMRRMFEEIDTEFIWWFDDDSYVTNTSALDHWVRAAQTATESTMIWGHGFFSLESAFSGGTDIVAYVKNAPWYHGLEPPSSKPGGRGEWNHEGKGGGDPRWFFVQGGSFLVRTRAIRTLDWPDPCLIKKNDDVFLCEAIRQLGGKAGDIGSFGVKINTSSRRGEGEDHKTMVRQMTAYARPIVTICVLTYGNYHNLARKCVESILANCDRSKYRLVVGMNAVGEKTKNYLEKLHAEGAIDRLYSSPFNINKCRMMRRMFTDIDTELIWWFDDDSYITSPRTMNAWLAHARKADAKEVQWGHIFFFGDENDFSYGTDVVSFVKNASWYRQKEPPSWKPGGKGIENFENKGIGDGRWHFVTGGCWLVRTRAIRELDWPDPRLVKRNDDVFLSEAIRQQGWKSRQPAFLGVAINKAPRRGEGEDRKTMARQIDASADSERISSMSCKRGCVFVPIRNNIDILYRNFDGRTDLGVDIDFYVFDENPVRSESLRVQSFCEANRWHYRKSDISGRGHPKDQKDNQGLYIKAMLKEMAALTRDYEYVVKMEPQTLIISPTWHQEFEVLLIGQSAIAGTLGTRRTKDTNNFWDLAKRAGYKIDEPEYDCVEGGLFAVAKKSLELLDKMPFLNGNLEGIDEAEYISFCCHLLGVEFFNSSTVGSWAHKSRPPIREIGARKAIYPADRSEWQEAKYSQKGE